MKAPPHAAITIALSTARYGARRPDERRETIYYLVDRLLSGEAVKAEALEHYGLKVSVRPAFKSEILDG